MKYLPVKLHQTAKKTTKKQVSLVISRTFTNKSDEKVRWWSAFSFSFPQLQHTAHELDRKLFMIVAGLVVDPAIQSSCTCKDTLNISVSYTVVECNKLLQVGETSPTMITTPTSQISSSENLKTFMCV